MRLLRSTFIIVTNTAFSLHKLTAGINTRCGKDDAVEGQYISKELILSAKSRCLVCDGWLLASQATRSADPELKKEGAIGAGVNISELVHIPPLQPPG